MIGKSHNNSSISQSQRFLRLNQLRQQHSMQRLATARRINSAADDPAGLIASESLSSALSALEAESRSTQRAQSIAATADGALAESSTLLTEAKRLAVANADGTLSDSERTANQMQIDAIVASVDRIANTTNFNGTKLLDGSFALNVTNASQPIASAGSAVIGGKQINGTTYSLADVKTGGDLSASKNRGEDTNAVIDQAIKDVTIRRAKVRAFSKNVLESRASSLSVAVENLSAARSLIRDTDYAAEAAERFRTELLATAGISTLKQAFNVRRKMLNLLA